MKYKPIGQHQPHRFCLSNEPAYINNIIQTSKYTWYSFIPKNLFEQFSKLANLYFLILAVLQSITVISISDGQPTILIPLVTILCITAVKDIFEDYKRKVSDRTENNNLVEQNGQQVQWQSLFVGQIVKIYKDQYLPADLLICSSSEPKGVCFIETKNLDGETNLKQKYAPKDLLEFLKDGHFQNAFTVEYDLPNMHLYRFQGTGYLDAEVVKLLRQREAVALKILQKRNQVNPILNQEYQNLQNEINTVTCPKFTIDINNVILRGSSLRNTQYIYGLVLYSGHDTKVMQNSVKPHYKKSKVEKQLGRQILVIFLVQIAICLFGALFYAVWYSQFKDELGYLEIDQDNAVDNTFIYNLAVRFGNWLLMFGNFVPISLLVTLETVKFIQGILISKDDNCAYGDTYCAVQSSNLNEELGQIHYVFSDKTGTLTKNQMLFKQFYVNGVSYGDIVNMEGITAIPNVNFTDTAIIEALQSSDKQAVLKAIIVLGLCHSAIVEMGVDKLPQYNVTSPDELALLQFARFVNLYYMGINEKSIITLKLNDALLQYELLHQIEFDSTRKCNSVIVKDLQTNKILIMSKGADSVMLAKQSTMNSQKVIQQYHHYLKEYSTKGLRVLLLGGREIPLTEYETWNKVYKDAQTTMVDRDQAISLAENQIEKDLELLGITAIEDQLQDEVDVTIEALRNAGIKVWVLTGDKIETAINIGYSCKLLTDGMKVQIVEQAEVSSIEKDIIDCDALVLSGDCIAVIMAHTHLTTLLIKVATQCRSVLCCRVSPAQKEQVVTLVRKYYPNISCVAIGDGANDVSMITSANVGIGIKGVEGQQAARASDYSIGEFRILRTLLFVHGRESYRRNSDLILYNFYKNIVLVFPQFWFAIFNRFSGQRLYDNIVFQLFNVFYTSVPIMIFAIFDDQLSFNELYSNKYKSYAMGLNNTQFTTKLFWTWFVEATAQSAIIGLFSFMTLEDTTVNGLNYSFWWTGTAVFGLTVVIANLKIILISHTWNVAGVFFLFGMIIMYILTLVVFNTSVSSDGVYSILYILFTTPVFYLNNLLVIVATVGTDLATAKLMAHFKSNNRIYNTSDLQQPDQA